MYLKRGTTFMNEEIRAVQGGFTRFTKRGYGEFYPLVVGAYGSPSLERPVLELELGTHTVVSMEVGDHVRDVVFESLDIYYKKRDPTQPGYDINWVRNNSAAPYAFRMQNQKSRILLQDVRVRNASYGVALEGINSVVTRVVLHRSVMAYCAAMKPENEAAHSHGLLNAETSGTWVEECVFDHNGWTEDASGEPYPGSMPVDQNHNIYDQEQSTGFTFLRCINARASNAGLQLRAGSGNLIDDCLFLADPESIGIGHPLNAFPTNAEAYDCVCTNNVVMYTRDGFDQYKIPRRLGHGLSAGLTNTIEVSGNIVCHGGGAPGATGWQAGGTQEVFGLSLSGLPEEDGDGSAIAIDVRVEGNIVYDWAKSYYTTIPNEPAARRGAAMRGGAHPPRTDVRRRGGSAKE
jgi:hypothetical protein